MSSTNKKESPRRRPARRSPSYRAPKIRARRTRRVEFALPFNRQLVITFRKFLTNPARSSKGQLILEVNGPLTREVAIAVRHQRRAKQARPVNKFQLFGLPARAAIASLLIVAGIGSSIFFATNLHKQVSFDIKPSQKVAAAAPVNTKVMPASVPTRLQIPKIGVDTQLTQVGLQANGQMETPWDITVASWYKYSPTPGQLGPSVIIGHLDGANYANMAGVFYRLHELTPGDEFSVTRADGSVATFKVLSLAQVPQNNFPTQQIYGNINYAGIRLITCGGTFNTATNHYTDNTVVFGALE